MNVLTTFHHSERHAFRFSEYDHVRDNVSLKSHVIFFALQQLEELCGQDVVLTTFNSKFQGSGSVSFEQEAARRQDSIRQVLSAADASEVILSLLRKDPFFLVDVDSEVVVKAKLDRLGKPFELGGFE